MTVTIIDTWPNDTSCLHKQEDRRVSLISNIKSGTKCRGRPDLITISRVLHRVHVVFQIPGQALFDSTNSDGTHLQQIYIFLSLDNNTSVLRDKHAHSNKHRPLHNPNLIHV